MATPPEQQEQHLAANSGDPFPCQEGEANLPAPTAAPTSVNTVFSYLSIVNPTRLVPPSHRHIEAVFTESPQRYAAIYMDDILIFSATMDKHASDLSATMRIILQVGVKIDKQRSVFCESVRLLGKGGEVEVAGEE